MRCGLPRCSMRLDLPDGVVSIVPGGRETGEALVRHRGVDKIAFTGSSATGRHIAAACGEQLKRVSLELGGKSAAIILDDADIDHTVRHLKMAGLMNNGQACVAQTRILVSERRHDEVVDALADMVSGLQVGDPADESTDVGPLVAQRQQQRVQGYIQSGIDEGAKVVVGGVDAPHDRGWYVRPTLFTDATNDMKIAREEIFGPVLTVLQLHATKPMRSGSPTTATTDWPDRCGRPTSRTVSRSQARSAPALTESICTSSTPARRSAGSNSPASAASSAPKVSRSTPRCSRR